MWGFNCEFLPLTPPNRSRPKTRKERASVPRFAANTVRPGLTESPRGVARTGLGSSSTQHALWGVPVKDVFPFEHI